MKQRFFTMFAALAAMICLHVDVFGAEVATSDAAIAAKAWLDRGYAMGKIPKDRTVASVDEVECSAAGARLLVAKFEGGGFVVMSADDLVDPVISFSASGDGIDTSDSNPFWALLRGDIAAREAAAGVQRGTSSASSSKRLLRSAASTTKTSAQKKWAELLGTSSSSGPILLRSSYPATTISDVRVDSFVQSRWNQSTHNNYTTGSNCYNYYTPNNYVCGCVATVGGQIMRYWQYPTESVAPKTFKCAVDNVETNCTMFGGTYDWSSMPLVPANGVTEAECQAIGKLTYDVGVSVGMAWAPKGSGSPAYDLALRFPDTFGYTNAVAAMYISGYYEYSLEEVKKVVIPNCDARAPMVMSISGAGSHAVLVDGYGYSGDDFCMHVNFGWSGSGDAWYCPPDFDTGSYNFTVINGFVFNIFPTSTGSILSGRVFDASGAPISGALVALQQGTETNACTMTDDNGIYSFIADPGTYLVTATYGEDSATIDATVTQTVGTELAGTGGYYYSTAVIGNSYANDIAITGVAAVTPPVLSPGSCLFYPSTNVTISCSDSEAIIYYTTDGSTPDMTSTTSLEYTGPIQVDDTVTIKARAFKSGFNPSPTVSATYTYDSAAGAPKGDYFDNPINISGTNGTYVIEDNSAYTLEEGEPYHTQYYQYHTVWYKWTAPGSGTMTFSTSCADAVYAYGTFVAVYVGDTLSSIERLAYSSEWVPADDYRTSVSVTVSQGQTYRIVGMTSGDDCTGEFRLSWSGNLTVTQSYAAWAEENGLGDPEVVTDGVANLFRYVFGITSGSFSPISSVGFDSSGNVVLQLPTIVNTEGVTLKVLSTTDLSDWTSSSVEEREVTITPEGQILFSDTSPSRFYRLKASLSE